MVEVEFDTLRLLGTLSELERTLEERIHGLQNQLETEQVECRRLLWANKDNEKEKQLDVQR